MIFVWSSIWNSVQFSRRIAGSNHSELNDSYPWPCTDFKLAIEIPRQEEAEKEMRKKEAEVQQIEIVAMNGRLHFEHFFAT